MQTVQATLQAVVPGIRGWSMPVGRIAVTATTFSLQLLAGSREESPMLAELSFIGRIVVLAVPEVVSNKRE